MGDVDAGITWVFTERPPSINVKLQGSALKLHYRDNHFQDYTFSYQLERMNGHSAKLRPSRRPRIESSQDDSQFRVLLELFQQAKYVKFRFSEDELGVVEVFNDRLQLFMVLQPRV